MRLKLNRGPSTSPVNSSTEKKETHHPDRLGTKVVTNVDSGASFEQSTLPFGTAFGNESTGYSNQVFTSYDRSSVTGLDYANNRTYSSGQGRFMQVDPIGMSAATIGDPQSNNMYSYVQNMPTDFVDPSGLQRIPFTRTVCLPWDGGPRVCVEVVVHWMDTGGASGDYESFGGHGGTQQTVDCRRKLLQEVLVRDASSNPSDRNKKNIPYINASIFPQFQAALNEINSKVGHIGFSEMFRDFSRQQHLFNNRANNSNPVARPGTSNHEAGFAFDVPASYRNLRAGRESVESIFIKHGFVKIKGDPPHFTWKLAPKGAASVQANKEANAWFLNCTSGY